MLRCLESCCRAAADTLDPHSPIRLDVLQRAELRDEWDQWEALGRIIVRTFLEVLRDLFHMDSVVWLRDCFWVNPCPPKDLLVAALSQALARLALPYDAKTQLIVGSLAMEREVIVASTGRAPPIALPKVSDQSATVQPRKVISRKRKADVPALVPLTAGPQVSFRTHASKLTCAALLLFSKVAHSRVKQFAHQLKVAAPLCTGATHCLSIIG